MSRLERLLNLIAALLHADRPLTRDEIRDRVPGYPSDPASFRRAFERDKEAMRDMGIPLDLEVIEGVTGRLTGEGYVIRREDYELPDPGLEPDELAALHLAATAVRLEGLPGTEALWKLGGAVGGAGPAVAAIPGQAELAPLFGAVAERRPVTMRYRGEERTIEPWRLSFQRGHWYLTGWDRLRGEERRFRLDRIEGDVVLGAAGGFQRPTHLEPGTLLPWELGQEEPVTARLLIDADQAAWAVRHLGDESVVARHDDGAVEVELRVTNRDAFRSFALGFLEHAEVLGPPEIRDDVIAWLEAIAAA